MTCGLAVKRPHDYENYLSSDGVVEVKRPRATKPHCSPFRPQFGTLAASLMQSTSNPTFSTEVVDTDGPFSNTSKKCQLSENHLESYLKAEIQYLKRRKLIPSRNLPSAQPNSSTTGYRRAAVSPSSSHSGSDSDGEQRSNDSKTNAENLKIKNLYEKPQFSLKQVKLICERLLKEQEIRLRFEYETVLNKKLAEQHDQYVQFAKEQIDCHNNNENDYFYLS